MFKGTALVTPNNREVKPFKVFGTWLYKPEFDCWYVNGASYPAAIVGDYQELPVS